LGKELVRPATGMGQAFSSGREGIKVSAMPSKSLARVAGDAASEANRGTTSEAMQQSTTAAARGRTRERILSGCLSCLSTFGLSKCSVDDIARAAGVSRATVYRMFPGGKSEILREVLASETRRILAEMRRVALGCDQLEDAVLRVGVALFRELRGHEVLASLLRLERNAVAARLTFERMEAILERAGYLATEVFAGLADSGTAERVGEWLVRLVASYVLVPVSEEGGAEEEAYFEEILRCFVVPGVRILAGGAPYEAGKRSSQGAASPRSWPNGTRDAVQADPLGREGI
jgi:AcrR family transcriptional regulator